MTAKPTRRPISTVAAKAPTFRLLISLGADRSATPPTPANDVVPIASIG
jgi:hypothetical protein